MANIYNFSIIRVCPDQKRGEVVNIGIAVFNRYDIDVHILPSLLKVHALHEEIDLSELYALPQKMNRIGIGKGSPEESHRALRQVGMVELSDLGQFRANNKEQYDEVVADLMSKLVRPTVARTERGTKTSRLRTELRDIIDQAGILGKTKADLAKHKIVQNYPVAPEKGLYADFAGKNSKHYFTETIDYRVSSKSINSEKFNESAKAAFVLYEARRSFKNSVRTIVYAATRETESSVRTHLNLASEFASDVVNFESAQDRARYMQSLATVFRGELPLDK